MNKKPRALKNSIKARLELVGKSQGWLSRETRIGRNHLSKIVNGHHNPQLLSAKLIARALNCLIDDLWTL